MKILHVLTQLPQKTGSGVYFTNLIDSMNKIGVISAALYGTERHHVTDVRASVIEEVHYFTEKLPFHICGMSDEMPYDSTVYGKMSDEKIELLLGAFREKLLKLKEEFKPDVVISHHLFLITNLVREIFPDIKVIGISHGTDIRQIKKHNKFIDRLKNLKDLDLVLTVTRKEDDSMINLLGIDKNKIKLVGGGYNEKVFYKNNRAKKDNIIRIMYAGKITESKGVFALASTLPILEEKYKNIELHIVGKTTKEIRDHLIKNANYSNNLWIYNAENQVIMADHLRDSDIFVLPSYFEALGLIAVEALACEKLVVTSEIEGLRELLGEKLINSGIIEFTKLPRIVDVDKPLKEDVKAYVERLSENIEKQIKRMDKDLFTKEVVDGISEFSWEKLGKRVVRILEDM